MSARDRRTPAPGDPALSRRTRPASTRARWAVGRRSLVASTGLLVRRRFRRDAPLLVGWVALVCVAAVLALAVPRLVLDTVDRGARDAVADIGPAGDVIVRTQVGNPRASSEFITLESLAELAGVVPDNLPPGLSRVAAAPSVSVASPVARLNRVVVDREAPRVEGRFGLLGDAQADALRLVEGRLPAAVPDGSEVEVVVSREAAETASLGVGTVLDAAAQAAGGGGPSTVRVVGVVEAARPVTPSRCATPWCDLPTMWAPEQRESAGGTTVEVTLLAAPGGVAVAEQLFLDPFEASIRVPLRPARFTSDLVTTVVRETDALEAIGEPLSRGTAATVDVRTEFPDAMRDFDDRAAASVAQMTLMIAGLFGAVAAVLLLVGGLLVRRRGAELSLERARGASLASVALRGLAESAVLAAVGVGAGVAVAALLTARLAPGAPTDPGLLVLVCAVAVLAPPAQAFLAVRSAWGGRREPANRRDRQQIAGRARARRIVLELSVVALATAALAAVRSRGLVEARTDGTDPLLAAAPLLLAVAVTVVVLRVQPVAVRAFAALAARSRGAVGLIGAAHAERSVAVLPLLALTLATALVVGGSLVVQTITDGQVAASWQRVGADARVEGPVADGEADAVRGEPGVDAASAVLSRTSVEVDSGAATAQATVVAVDDGFAGVAALLPAGLAPDAAALRRLAAASTGSDSVAVIASSQLATRVDLGNSVLVVDGERIPVDVVATFDGGPRGYLNAPYVFVDLEAFAAQFADPPAADTLLVMGDGAADAAGRVDGATEVVTRAGWFDERREQPLVQGVEWMTLFAIAAVGLLAAIALVTTVAAGGRSRSRSLSLLRTLGVRRGFGWVLALAELAPLVVAALLGGAAAGVAILVAVGPALGLRILAGGVGEPPLSLDVSTVILVVAGSLVLCAIAIAVDTVAHLRDRPGDVLRVGETT